MDRYITKYGVIIVIIGLLALIIQGDLFSLSPIILAGQALAVALMVSARFAFRNQRFNMAADPADGPLVRHGPYKYIRHPMYTGMLLLIWFAVLGHWSILNGIIGVAVLATIILRIPVEEKLLSDHYPEYADYQKQSKRIIPFVY